jgi:archaemetzincin
MLFDIEHSFSAQRRQYYSTKVIESVKKSNPVSDGFVLILTEMDLFVPVLTHIFGEAELNGRYSIVSVCRLYEEFYTSESEPSLVLERSYKEIIHELGHNIGLKHCKDWMCVMHSSSGIEEVDIKGSIFCEECHSLVKYKGFVF